MPTDADKLERLTRSIEKLCAIAETIRDCMRELTAAGEAELRRTNEDKRRAVLKLFADAEWVKWSDREIAEKCGVSHSFVSSLRPKPQPSRTFTHPKTGAPTTMNTAAIGHRGRPRARAKDTTLSPMG